MSKHTKPNKKKFEELRDFDHSLPMSLLKAREAVMKQFIPSLRAHGLSPEQWRVIRALNQEGTLEMAEIAKRCYLLSPSISRIAQNLESRNLIKREKVESDQRRSTLKLTGKGKQLFSDIAPESQRRYVAITEKFGDDKLELLYDLLEDLELSLNKER